MFFVLRNFNCHCLKTPADQVKQIWIYRTTTISQWDISQFHSVCVCEGDGGWGGGEKSLNKWNHGKNIEIFYHEGDVVFGHSL